MFGALKNKISSLWHGIGSKIKSLFGFQGSDSLQLADLETLLLNNDVGVSLTQYLLEETKKLGVSRAEQLSELFSSELLKILQNCKPVNPNPSVLMLVGINGVGKTSFAGKYAHHLKQQGKKVLLVAADTFRAAAQEQLVKWAQDTGIEVVLGKPEQDAASVVFVGAQRFLDGNFDNLIIDTAGRLHNKSNLMSELSKINKVLTKKLGDTATASTWLVLDAMLGQSSINQVELFDGATTLDGLVLTKCDGVAKGGFVFAAAYKYQVPVVFTSSGQTVDDIVPFDAKVFVNDFLK